MKRGYVMFKKITAVLLALLMIMPVAGVSASAENAATEKNFEISFSEEIFGYPLPDSHLDIAVRDTYKYSASSS